MNGAEVYIATLREAGIRYVFGTPGSTEAALLDALAMQEEIQFVLALHESVAVSMADGMARASQGLGVVCVHATVGTANTLGMLINAFTDRSAVLVTAGVKDQRALGTGVFCDSPYQVTDILRQYTKWSWQVLDPCYLGRDLAKALRLCQNPVQSPVFVGIPENFFWSNSEKGDNFFKSITPNFRGDQESIKSAVEMLHTAANPVLMVGNEVGRAGALAEAVSLAEYWQIPVLTEERNAWTDLNFPTNHPLYIGSFSPKSSFVKEADVVLAIGARMFMPMGFQTNQYFSPETKVIQINSDSSRISAVIPVSLGIISEARTALRDLLDASQAVEMNSNRQQEQLRKINSLKSEQSKAKQDLLRRAESVNFIKVQLLISELSRQASDDAVIINEGVRSGYYLQDYFDFTAERGYFAYNGGCLGWGAGAAIGVKLANPNREVIAFLGDGSFLFSPQALWTAAHYGVALKVVICNNRAYMAVKGALLQYNGPAASEGKFLGYEFKEPAIDYAALCKGFGVPAWRADKPAELPDTIKQFLRHQGPAVLEVVLDSRDMEKRPE